MAIKFGPDDDFDDELDDFEDDLEEDEDFPWEEEEEEDDVKKKFDTKIYSDDLNLLQLITKANISIEKVDGLFKLCVAYNLGEFHQTFFFAEGKTFAQAAARVLRYITLRGVPSCKTLGLVVDKNQYEQAAVYFYHLHLVRAS